MRTIKLTLAYDGGEFAGWQVQSGQRTVQGTLQSALARITGEDPHVVGSGRTDSGVHALGQVASFSTASELPPHVLLKALRAELPDDISALAAEDVAEGFHAIRDAVSKRYRYVIHDGPQRDVFRRRYVWNYRRRLDAAAMRQAGRALCGTHDFRSFESAWPQRNSSVRTVLDLDVTRGAGDEVDLVTIEIEADGFLYNMTRAIVGTLVEVGRGVRGVEWPAEVLAAQSRQAAGMTAPPEGLFLLWVRYAPRNAGEESRGAPAEPAPDVG